MNKILKGIITSGLAGFGLKISRDRRGEITGIDLFSDLRVLIPKKSPVCFDVGANQGQTIDALQKALRDPYVYAFEPSSKTFQLLQDRNYRGKIAFHNCGMGAEDRKSEFINYASSVLSSFLPIDSSEDNRFREVAEEIREVVRIQTVDGFISDHKIRTADLLKIDAQGFDLEVLRGAKQTFLAGLISYVLVELNFVRMYTGQAMPGEIIEFLERNGLYLIDYYEKVRRKNTIAWCTALFGKR